MRRDRRRMGCEAVGREGGSAHSKTADLYPKAMIIIRPYDTLGGVCYNPGDNIVERGAETLLKDVDATALIGTPWFWDGCERSDKYAWLERELDTRSGERLIAIGIGSCVTLGDAYGSVLRRPETIEACKRIWSRFAVIAVRDPVAWSFLTELNIVCGLLPCPSVFYPLPKSVCITAPAPGSRLYVDAPRWHSDMSIAACRAHVPDGFDHFTYRPGYYDSGRLDVMLTFLASYETIVSARIHALLPLARLRKTAVVPFDSRATTATCIGIPTWPDAPTVASIDVNAVRDCYAKLLALQSTPA